MITRSVFVFDVCDDCRAVGLQVLRDGDQRRLELLARDQAVLVRVKRLGPLLESMGLNMHMLCIPGRAHETHTHTHTRTHTRTHTHGARARARAGRDECLDSVNEFKCSSCDGACSTGSKQSVIADEEATTASSPSAYKLWFDACGWLGSEESPQRPTDPETRA